MSRSREGAWIEIDGYVIDNQIRVSRSREGAWIEMVSRLRITSCISVAPVRERGLKSRHPARRRICMSRSREGAWIEIGKLVVIEELHGSLP